MLEEVKVHLENAHVKYHGIISKAREIKDQEMRLEDFVVSETKIYEMHVQSEGKPSNVKDFKEDKKININIIKEEDEILVNIHGTRHHKTIIQQVIIIDQQIGEASTMIHGIKGKQLCNK
jgi:hypothetical protein